MTQKALDERATAEEAWTSVDVRAAIRQQAEIARRGIEVLSDRVSELLDSLGRSSFSRIVLTGCGDSYYAALATKLAFEKWTRTPTEALPSMEFSRYGYHVVDADTLVVCLSNSGRVSRTIESAKTASEHGASVVAVTGRPDSDLATTARFVLSQHVPTPDLPTGAGSLGLANYLVTALALYELALQLAERSATLSRADVIGMRAQLAGVPGAIEQTYDICDVPAREYAASFLNSPVVYVLGAGPSLATAYFGCAKCYEQPQFEAVPQELEEWAHEQYFMVVESTPVLFVAPPGPSRDRSLELFEAAALRGGTVAVIGGVADTELGAAADFWLPVEATGLSEELSPLVYVVPLELVADALGSNPERLPRPPRREVPPEIEDAFEYRRIYGSEMVHR